MQLGQNGISESCINLKIVQKTQYLLEQAGCTVILTRSDENGIYEEESSSIRNKKISDMNNRVDIGNNSEADIFVSVHLNKINQEQYWGWQTFYNNKDTSRKLATAIQMGLNTCIKRKNDRQPLRIENKYLMENVQIPATTVECGFLSNLEESKLLQTEEYQNKISWGIYLGIINYFME